MAVTKIISLMNLPRSPTSANFHQDIILHIQVVHQLQVKLMHSLIREWFLNSFLVKKLEWIAQYQNLRRKALEDL